MACGGAWKQQNAIVDTCFFNVFSPPAECFLHVAQYAVLSRVPSFGFRPDSKFRQIPEQINLALETSVESDGIRTEYKNGMHIRGHESEITQKAQMTKQIPSLGSPAHSFPPILFYSGGNKTVQISNHGATERSQHFDMMDYMIINPIKIPGIMLSI